ncbi:hypothetical protein [Sporisorium scitamineum]|uniref:Uncharacterized protein n=1 Tax=Sporisorium scitamineum TaxID=49012 RepID=A0A0F7RVN6_9BASI|nr:hypothetical protein [Sporisorium scitamineum]
MLVVAPDAPQMWAQEKVLYDFWANDYLTRYPADLAGRTQRISSLNHMLPAHKDMEKQALEYALIDGNGPFMAQEMPGVTFAMTLIPGNSRPGLSWNLRQSQKPPLDGLAFWRINRNGARLLAFDRVSAGAHAQQVSGMQEIIAKYD